GSLRDLAIGIDASLSGEIDGPEWSVFGRRTAGPFVAIGGIADMNGRIVSANSVEIDPDRTNAEGKSRSAAVPRRILCAIVCGQHRRHRAKSPLSPHVCCGAVRNGCGDVSAPRLATLKPSAAPLPAPKLAMACTSCPT